MSIKLNGATSVSLDVPAVVGGDFNLSLPGAGTVDRLERAGNIIQVVNVHDGAYATASTTIPLDNTIPQNTEGTEYMSLAITPTSATSKLLITVNAGFAVATGDWVSGAIFQDSDVNALASWAVYQASPGASGNCNFSHFMTAGTTSATTFKFRAGTNGGVALYFNGNTGGGNFGGTTASSITITEIAA